jgi:hypothetical protein
VQALWDGLSGGDAAKAYQSKRALVSGEQAVPLLRERVRPVRLEPGQLARLVAGLEARQFKTRDKAAKELAKLGELARPALTRALEGKPSLEVRRRIEDLLNTLSKALPSAEEVTALRAVEVLEGIGTAAARTVLNTLAGGDADARLTQEARAALRRLARPPRPRGR